MHCWTPQLIRSTKTLFGVCRVNETKLQVPISDVVEIKCFIVTSLMEQTLFQVTLTDIGTKLFLDQSGR